MLLPVLRSLGGVASTRMLATEHGVTAQEIAAAVARGDVERVRQGWIALPTADAAVVAAARVGGALSCISVLQRLGVWCVPDQHLHVRLPPNVGRARSPGDRRLPLSDKHAVRLHRPAWPATPRRAVDDPAVALALAVVCQPRFDAVASLDSALNRGFVTLSALHDLLAPLPAVHRGYLGLVDAGAQSGLETKARLSLRRCRVQLRSQVQIPGVGRVDLLVGERLVLELDGWTWHSLRPDFEEDRRRDLALTALGFQVLRLSYDQVTNAWPECEAVILGLIRARKHLWPRVGRRTV